MAEPLGQQRELRGPSGPSGLRNELRFESGDEGSQGSDVQAFDSQFIVPETQLTDPFYGDAIPDASDDTDAFLAKYTVSKPTAVAEKNIGLLEISAEASGFRRQSSPETNAFRMAPVLMKGKPLNIKPMVSIEAPSGRRPLHLAAEQKGAAEEKRHDEAPNNAVKLHSSTDKPTTGEHSSKAIWPALVPVARPFGIQSERTGGFSTATRNDDNRDRPHPNGPSMHAPNTDSNRPMPVRKRRKKRDSASNMLAQDSIPLMQRPRHSQGEQSLSMEPTPDAHRHEVEQALQASFSVATVQDEAVANAAATTEPKVQPLLNTKGYEERAQDCPDAFNIGSTSNIHPMTDVEDDCAQFVGRTNGERIDCQNIDTVEPLNVHSESHSPQGSPAVSHSHVPETHPVELLRQLQPRRGKKLIRQPRALDLLNAQAPENIPPPRDSGISVTQTEQMGSQDFQPPLRELEINITPQERAHPETSQYFNNPCATFQGVDWQSTKHTPANESPVDLPIPISSKTRRGAAGDMPSSIVVAEANAHVDLSPPQMVGQTSVSVYDHERTAQDPYTVPMEPPRSVQNGIHHQRQLEYENQTHGIRSHEIHGGGSAPITNDPTPQMSIAPSVSNDSTSAYNRPFRVTKPQKKPQPRGQRAPGVRTNHPGPPKPTHMDIFEQQLQGLRVSFYAESVRHESHFGAQVQIRDTRIVDLEEQVKRAQEHVIEVERKDVERLTKAKQQRDAVKDLQKYVKGLSTDHAKFKETMKAHEKTCSKILETKLSEFQHDKAELEGEFLSTVENIEKSRRCTKELLQDCYTKLEVSESKRIGLLDNLRVQSALYEVERKKRTELEQQVVGSLQTIKLGLQNTEGVLLEKLNSLELVVNDPTKDEGWAAPLKECLYAVKGLQGSSLLTVKDAQKAEGMLRFIQKNFEENFSKFSTCIKGKEVTADAMRECVANELSSLRTDMSKFQETNAELQRYRLFSETLKDQLESEKVKREKMEKRIEALLRSENDLKLCRDQLQAQMASMKEQAISEEGHELVDLREKLRQGNEDLKAARLDLECAERTHRHERNEVNKWKELTEESRANLAKMTKKHENQIDQASQDAIGIREQLATQHKRDLELKQNEWNEKQRKMVEKRDELDSQLQDQKTRNTKLIEESLAAERKLRDVESTLSTARKEKDVLEERLKNSAREKATASTDTLRLKEQLKSKHVDVQARDQDLKSLRQQLEVLRNDKVSLEGSNESLKTQLEEHLTTIKNLQDESQTQATNREKNLQRMLESTKKELSTLSEEKKDLEKQLEKAHADTRDSTVAAETRFNHEKKRLKEDIRKLEDAKKADEQTLTDKIEEDAQKSAAETARIEEELRDAKQQLEEALVNLKQSEVECKKIREKAITDLETHKKVTANFMEKKVAEAVRTASIKLEQKKQQEIADICRQLMADSQERGQRKHNEHASQALLSQLTTEDLVTQATKSLSNLDSKSRRKVNRHEQSNRPPTPIPSTAVMSSDSTNLTYPNRLGDREHLDETGVALRHPSFTNVSETQDSRLGLQSQTSIGTVIPDTQHTIIPETQDTVVPGTQRTVIPETQESDTYSQARPFKSIPPPKKSGGQDLAHDILFRSSTSDLSSLPESSPKSLRLLNERGLVTPTGREYGQDQYGGRVNANGPSSTGFVADGRSHHLESPIHPRPTSQANTGSRMAPPPMLLTHGRRKPSKGPSSPAPAETSSTRPSHGFTGHDVSTQPPSSSNKLQRIKINGPKGISNASRKTDVPGAAPPFTVESSGLKRKEAPSRASHDTPKRAKVMPSDPPSSVSHNCGPSVARSGRIQAYSQARGSSHSGATSVTRQGSGPRRKSSRYDLRFNEELGRR